MAHHYFTLFYAVYNFLYRISSQKQKNNQYGNILISQQYNSNANPTSTDIGFFLSLFKPTVQVKERA